ncbi:MAG: SH3 domain-containing protein [Terriglobales bacterium]
MTFFSACKRGGKLTGGEPAYVSAQQVNLRDRLAAVYNKRGVVKNGDRVEVLEKSKRFVRVRTANGEEGWMEARYLVGPEVFDSFSALEKDNAASSVQARGITRTDLNMHVSPGRETEHLYRIAGNTKLDILKRAVAEKPGPARPGSLKPAAAASAGAEKTANAPAEVPPPQLEDWLLVRDPQQRHTGWVLARMVDIDVPLEIAQYAEGQRIMASFVLNQVKDYKDDQARDVPQYLVLVNEPKDGMPFDFNQLRVFTWNTKRHRYETAYRERKLEGFFPVQVGHEVFDKEGDLPFFVVRTKDDSGNILEKKYKLNGPIVRRVLSSEEQQKAAAEKAARRAAAPPRKAQSRRRGRR